jgi:hypothetical protein
MSAGLIVVLSDAPFKKSRKKVGKRHKTLEVGV